MVDPDRPWRTLPDPGRAVDPSRPGRLWSASVDRGLWSDLVDARLLGLGRPLLILVDPD